MTKTEKKEAIHFQFEGEVVSVKENKTIHVLVKTTKLHEKYKKQYVTSRKYAVMIKVKSLGVCFISNVSISKTKMEID